MAHDAPGLPEDAAVVRFGLLTIESFQDSVELEEADTGRLGLSVYVVPGATILETCTAAGLRHRQIRTATVAKLSEEGFKVVADGEDGHCLVLVDDVSGATWEKLNAVFAAPEPNPAVMGG